MTTTKVKPADAEALLSYAESVVYFNGRITFRNVETGEHRTISIRTQADDAKFAPGKRIVALLTGPENETDYTGFAFADDARGIVVWRKKRESGPWNWYATMIDAYFRGESGRVVRDGETIRIDAEQESERVYTVHLEKRCSICNRALTVPESIEAGIGPICLAKMGA